MYRIFFSVLLLCAYTDISIAGDTVCASTFEEKEVLRKKARAEWIAGVNKARESYHDETILDNELKPFDTEDTIQVISERRYSAESEKKFFPSPAHSFSYITTMSVDGRRENAFEVTHSFRSDEKNQKSSTTGRWAMFLDYLDMQKAMADYKNIPAFDFIEDGSTAEIIHREVNNNSLVGLISTYYEEKEVLAGSTVTVSRNSTDGDKKLFYDFLKLIPEEDDEDRVKFRSHNGSQTRGFVNLVSKHERRDYVINSIEIAPLGRTPAYGYDITFSVVDET